MIFLLLLKGLDLFLHHCLSTSDANMLTQRHHCESVSMLMLACSSGLQLAPSYLLHVAAQFGVRRFVDSVPVHRDLYLLVQLEDHQSVIDVSVTQWQRQEVTLLCRWLVWATVSPWGCCWVRVRVQFLRVEVVHSRIHSQRVHPVPEGSLLPRLTCNRTHLEVTGFISTSLLLFVLCLPVWYFGPELVHIFKRIHSIQTPKYSSQQGIDRACFSDWSHSYHIHSYFLKYFTFFCHFFPFKQTTESWSFVASQL